ncbi:peptidoglycan editing factor PgeF [Hydrogenophaga aquatica]
MQDLIAAGTHWPAGVRAVFTTRNGGVSAPPFDSWNLGDHVGDAPEAVAENRQRLTVRLQARPVFLKQVHGCDALRLQGDTADQNVADACWTSETGVACTVMVADCLPLLFSTADGSSVAAVHAGWRGLVGHRGTGVIESLCRDWPAVQLPGQLEGLRVWLGPCIGPTAFEVGEDVRSAFAEHDPTAARHFQPQGGSAGPKYLCNLPALARDRLARLGITSIHGNDGSTPWCTVSNPSLFFSHRRDAARLGSTGRMAACIWRA